MVALQQRGMGAKAPKIRIVIVALQLRGTIGAKLPKLGLYSRVTTAWDNRSKAPKI